MLGKNQDSESLKMNLEFFWCWFHVISNQPNKVYVSLTLWFTTFSVAFDELGDCNSNSDDFNPFKKIFVGVSRGDIKKLILIFVSANLGD